MDIKTISILSGLLAALIVAYLGSYGKTKKISLDIERNPYTEDTDYRISDSIVGKIYSNFLRKLLPITLIDRFSTLFGINPSVLEKQIKIAGLDKVISPLEIIVMKVLGILSGVVIALIAIRMKSLMFYILAFMAFLALFLYPQDKIKDLIKKRNDEILSELPSFIEQVYMCIEAGANLLLALKSVSERSRGPLGEEFQKAFIAASYGNRWQNELSRMAYNLQIEPLQDFVNDISIAQEKGSGIDISEVLRDEVSHMVSINRSRILGKIASLNTSLSFPIVFFCVLPLMGIIMAPQLINFMEMM